MANETSDLSYADTLWKSADALRGQIDAAEYKHVVLGLLFLKYISDSFQSRRDELHAELNIWYMRAFHLAWTEGVANLRQTAGEKPPQILQQPAGELGPMKLPQAASEIPWFHNVVLIEKPVGVARYVTKLVESLPKELAGQLPSIEQIEAELGKGVGDAR